MKHLLFLCAVLTLFLMTGCSQKAAPVPAPAQAPVSPEDIPAADIRFVNGDETPFSLADAFGDPILLKFWAAEHADAEAEMRALVHAYEQHKENVLFYLIDLTGDADIKSELFERHPDLVPPFPCYFDPDGSCRKAYALSSTQASFFIDRDGFLATWVDGSITEEALLFGLKMI